VAVAASLVGPATPASAYRDPTTLHVKLRQHQLIHRPAITGISTLTNVDNQSPLTSVSPNPSDCETEPVGCEVIPLELDIPQDDPDAIEAQGYILTIVLDWTPGPELDNLPEVGTVHSNELDGWLFQTPPIHNSTGSDTYTATTNSTQPGSMVAVSPTSSKFLLMIANTIGVNSGYTLEIDLTNAADVAFDPSKYSDGTTKPPAYVQPTFVPPTPGTPQESGFGGSVGPGTPAVPPPAFAGPAPIVVPKIANGAANQQLVALSRVTVRTGLARKALDKVDNKVSDVTIGKSSHRSIWLTLLALPVLALVVAVVLLARRKRTSRPAF
ncbi:MAG: hypothetical protein JWM40_2705, partial [Frankiales bacterium]|nr:hypothetical protein [Frankiales bacterium]